MQQIFTTYNGSLLRQLASIAWLQLFVRRVLRIGALLSFIVYASVRLMFHDFPVEPIEEIVFILRIYLAGCGITALCIAVFCTLAFIADNPGQLQKQCLLCVSVCGAFLKKLASSKTIDSNNLSPVKG